MVINAGSTSLGLLLGALWLKRLHATATKANTMAIAAANTAILTIGPSIFPLLSLGLLSVANLHKMTVKTTAIITRPVAIRVTIVLTKETDLAIRSIRSIFLDDRTRTALSKT